MIPRTRVLLQPPDQRQPMGAAERGGAGGAVPGALLAPAGEAQPIAAPVQLEAGAHHPLQGGGAAAHQR